MNAKEFFFKKIEAKFNNDKAMNNKLHDHLKEFQDKTLELIMEIKYWFEGSSISCQVDDEILDEYISSENVYYLKSLTLKNGCNVLRIYPEGLRLSGGVYGSLKVEIINNRDIPDVSYFFINMHDSGPRVAGVSQDYEGWVIVTGNHEQRIVEAFNKENFFSKLDKFA